MGGGVVETLNASHMYVRLHVYTVLSGLWICRFAFIAILICAKCTLQNITSTTLDTCDPDIRPLQTLGSW